MYAKEPGGLIYIVGLTRDELGGSSYYDLFGAIGNDVPKVEAKKARLTFNALSRASQAGLIRAMHDCSEGGIAIACAEMAFSGGLGMEVFLSEVPYKTDYRLQTKDQRLRNDFVLFSESNSRFIVEVAKKNQKKFEASLRGIPFGLIGCTSAGNKFKVHGLDGSICIESGIDELKRAWKEPLAW
jgi:phosphoribosylformylglycinamidine synthase